MAFCGSFTVGSMGRAAMHGVRYGLTDIVADWPFTMFHNALTSSSSVCHKEFQCV